MGKTINFKPCHVEIIFFDYGGVLAEEGFKKGLFAIAKLNGLDPENFYKKAVEVAFNDGFVMGRTDEQNFWQTLRDRTHIEGSDEAFRKELLSRFTLRPWMMGWVKRLKKSLVRSVILSDQTNWLDELEEKQHFSQWFDRVFNSYHLGKSKRDSSIFNDVLLKMDVTAEHALFVDDSRTNIETAKKKGLHTILYRNRAEFEIDLRSFFPFLDKI